jgi:hypothetical protein
MRMALTGIQTGPRQLELPPNMPVQLGLLRARLEAMI